MHGPFSAESGECPILVCTSMTLTVSLKGAQTKPPGEDATELIDGWARYGLECPFVHRDPQLLNTLPCLPSDRRPAPASIGPRRTLRCGHLRTRTGSHRSDVRCRNLLQPKQCGGFWKRSRKPSMSNKAPCEAASLQPPCRPSSGALLGRQLDRITLRGLNIQDLKLVLTDWDACCRHPLQPIRHGDFWKKNSP